MNDCVLDGVEYHDDRMFILYLCPCTVTAAGPALIETTIYHEEQPANHKWCVATYRNVPGYRMYRVDHFETVAEARTYVEQVEPETPLVSLGGRSPATPVPYREFVAWKQRLRLREYDYAQLYLPGGSHARERVIGKR